MAAPPRLPFRRVPLRLAEAPLPYGAPGSEPASLTVSAFVARLNGVLRAALPETWVKGEVGDFRVWSSGHAYFTLKDAGAALPAVIWATDLGRVPFRPEDGMEVLARGRPDVWAKTGKLSFVVSELSPVGIGALQLALEQLKARLLAEGLFDPARKKPLPLLPRRIGVVTSRHGAAVRDVLKVLSMRFPDAHVTIYPVAVQGATAPAEIARALEAFSRLRAADVVIVARGGGSKEDLAAFNDERVVRAVAACAVATVSAVGHEIDVTLTDLAADVRAATPSQAAELVVARREELDAALAGLSRELTRAIRSRLLGAHAAVTQAAAGRALAAFPERVARHEARLDAVSSRLRTAVVRLPEATAARLARLEGALLAWPERSALAHLASRVGRDAVALRLALSRRREAAAERLAGLAGALAALDPLRVLSRGYSITYRGDETAPLTDPGAVAPGDPLRIVLATGTIRARAEGSGKESAR